MPQVGRIKRHYGIDEEDVGEAPCHVGTKIKRASRRGSNARMVWPTLQSTLTLRVGGRNVFRRPGLFFGPKQGTSDGKTFANESYSLPLQLRRCDPAEPKDLMGRQHSWKLSSHPKPRPRRIFRSDWRKPHLNHPTLLTRACQPGRCL